MNNNLRTKEKNKILAFGCVFTFLAVLAFSANANMFGGALIILSCYTAFLWMKTTGMTDVELQTQEKTNTKAFDVQHWNETQNPNYPHSAANIND